MLVAFNVIHDLPGSPVCRIVDLAVFLDDLLQLLFTVQLKIDHLHDGHQVEVVLHNRFFALVSLQECRLALGECSYDIGVEQFMEQQSGKENIGRGFCCVGPSRNGRTLMSSGLLMDRMGHRVSVASIS